MQFPVPLSRLSVSTIQGLFSFPGSDIPACCCRLWGAVATQTPAWRHGKVAHRVVLRRHDEDRWEPLRRRCSRRRHTSRRDPQRWHPRVPVSTCRCSTATVEAISGDGNIVRSRPGAAPAAPVDACGRFVRPTRCPIDSRWARGEGNRFSRLPAHRRPELQPKHRWLAGSHPADGRMRPSLLFSCSAAVCASSRVGDVG